jgi:hypothetical protein
MATTGGSAGEASGGAAGSGGTLTTTGGAAGAAGQGTLATYRTFTEPSNWTTFVLSAAQNVMGPYNGGTFDGTYVYFAPQATNAAARYDTTRQFVATASWSAFAIGSAVPGASGFRGAVFGHDGVHLVPFPAAQAVKYYTDTPFSAEGSWLGQTVNTGGYLGGTFDGRWVYYVPHASGGVFHGLAARYDSRSPFDEPTAWQSYDITSDETKAGARGFYGALYAQPYVYFVPNASASVTFHGNAVRYDTRSAFDAPAAWEMFDIASLNSQARGFAGGVFDGRHVYYVPHANANAQFHGLVARYDSQGSFTDPSSWLIFDAAQVDQNAKGFVTGAFDGRFVYFVPNGGGTLSLGLVLRYDTELDFNEPSSFQVYDITAQNQAARGFLGAVFDGTYLYLVPNQQGVVARFHARDPGSLGLPYAGGSFF